MSSAGTQGWDRISTADLAPAPQTQHQDLLPALAHAFSCTHLENFAWKTTQTGHLSFFFWERMPQITALCSVGNSWSNHWAEAKPLTVVYNQDL